MTSSPERLREALTSMHGVLDRFRTVRVVARGWDLEAGVRRETETHLWYDAPSRIREERRVGDWSDFVISDGERRWWSFDETETRVDDASPQYEPAESHVARVLDPARLLPALEIDEVEETSHLGRTCILLRASRRGSSIERLRHELEDVVRFKLVVDRERGVLLRRDDYGHDGQVAHEEVVAIEFDEPISAETFFYQQREGVLLRDHAELQRVLDESPRTLEGAVPLMPFEVFVLRGRKPDHVLPHQADEERGIPASLTINYGFGLGREVTLVESALPEGEPEAAEMRTEPGEGSFTLLRSDGGEHACVRVTIGRTQVEMHSWELDEDALIERAASLEPIGRRRRFRWRP